MKLRFVLVGFVALICRTTFGQSPDANKIEIAVGGSFAKPKIVPKLEKLGIAQVTINYKLSSTAKIISKDGSTGVMAGAKISAYLETTDGELTEADLQEISDYFYSYFQKKLKANNIDTVSWATITATDFYKNGSEKSEGDKKGKNENSWITNSAHKGNTLYNGSIVFAFGKIKKASRFSEDIGAPAGYFHLTVDFADLYVDLDIKTTKESNMFYSKSTQRNKYSWAVKPQMKVVPNNLGMSLLWNEKSQAESLVLRNAIDGTLNYADAATEDASKMKNSMWAFRKELKPVVIETTKAKYKAAAKDALEKYADAFVEKCKLLKKD